MSLLYSTLHIFLCWNFVIWRFVRIMFTDGKCPFSQLRCIILYTMQMVTLIGLLYLFSYACYILVCYIAFKSVCFRHATVSLTNLLQHAIQSHVMGLGIVAHYFCLLFDRTRLEIKAHWFPLLVEIEHCKAFILHFGPLMIELAWLVNMTWTFWSRLICCTPSFHSFSSLSFQSKLKLGAEWLGLHYKCCLES